MTAIPSPENRRPPGRPRSAHPLSAAERMRAMRMRTLHIVRETDDTLEHQPLTGLLDTLRVGFQQKQAWVVAAVTAELLERLAEDPATSPRIKAEFTEY